MAMQCWVDDSGSEPNSEIFVFAGFISPHDQWAAFSDEWQAALDKAPKLGYFKMSEALGLRDEFSSRRGWTEDLRDERVAELADIAVRHAQIRVSAWIRNDDWAKYVASLPSIVRRFATDSPSVMLAEQLVLAVAVFGDRHGLREPCDYYFDENEAMMAELPLHWPMFRWLIENGTRSDLRKFIGSVPSFRDEKCFLPLQAADLYASLVRQQVVRNRIIYAPPSITLRKFARTPSIVREYSTAELQRLRDYLIRMGEQFARENPNIPLQPPIKDKRQRKNAHRRARKLTPPSSPWPKK